ncbi:MAG TPA: tetratricopeptide repeat protein [Phycisphaerae bacterium]|nr:tetratricopeptide repeat protein [Phycisphaerae bacterium]
MAANDPKSTVMPLQQAFELAMRHHQAGRLSEAEQLYRQVLAHQPNNADARHLLGVIAYQTGHNDLAVGLIRQAIALRPSHAAAYFNLGIALQAKGQFDDAIDAYRQAITRKPDYAEAHNNLGNVLRDKRQVDKAIAAYRRAIELNPNYAEARSNLGNALRNKGQLDEAIAAYQRAIALKPNYAEAHNNLGNALKDKGQLDEAISAYRRAIALKPDYAEAHNNLGNALRDKGQLDEAITTCSQAIVLKPNDAEANYNLSLLLLLRGDFQQGWERYQWRSRCANFLSLRRNFTQPQWDGSALETRTLLLHTEQGFGDAVQFIRYLPLVVQRGGKIIIECQAALQRLFRTMSGKCQIVAKGESLPAFDLYCPLLSLPLVFGTTLENIPQTVPYLHTDVQEAKRWQDRVNEHSPGLKVGLVWAGNSTHKNDRNRSMKLSSLALLGQVSGVHFFSLQKGEAAAQARTPPAGLELVDWTDELKDFADTAALIANLDLVITVDTAVAHLAGAMGKRVWTLLPFIPDWRWMLGREDSPWYPTMRLFRQGIRGDWDGVIKRVVHALSLWIKNHA